MSDNDFKKYLKYKQKYLELSKQIKLKNQKGGWWGINIYTLADVVTHYNGIQHPSTPSFLPKGIIDSLFDSSIPKNPDKPSYNSIKDANFYLNIYPQLNRVDTSNSLNIFVDGMNLLRNNSFCILASLLIKETDRSYPEPADVTLMRHGLWHTKTNMQKPGTEFNYDVGDILKTHHNYNHLNISYSYHNKTIDLLRIFLVQLFMQLENIEGGRKTNVFITAKTDNHELYTFTNDSITIYFLGVNTHSGDKKHNESDDLVLYYLFNNAHIKLDSTCQFISGDNYKWINSLIDAPNKRFIYHQCRSSIQINYSNFEDDIAKGKKPILETSPLFSNKENIMQINLYYHSDQSISNRLYTNNFEIDFSDKYQVATMVGIFGGPQIGECHIPSFIGLLDYFNPFRTASSIFNDLCRFTAASTAVSTAVVSAPAPAPLGLPYPYAYPTAPAPLGLPYPDASSTAPLEPYFDDGRVLEDA